MRNNKERLFEVMGRLDPSFTLNEDLTSGGNIKLSPEEIEASRNDYNKFVEMMKKKGFEKRNGLWFKNNYPYVLSPEGEYLLSKK